MCGFKEVYSFLHITYPYSCICSILQHHPSFCECFISCDGDQLNDFKVWGVDLKLEGVRYNYRDASQAAYMLGPPPARGGDLELQVVVNVSL